MLIPLHWVAGHFDELYGIDEEDPPEPRHQGTNPGRAAAPWTTAASAQHKYYFDRIIYK